MDNGSDEDYNSEEERSESRKEAKKLKTNPKHSEKRYYVLTLHIQSSKTGYA